jgi:hypothetical protein
LIAVFDDKEQQQDNDHDERDAGDPLDDRKQLIDLSPIGRDVCWKPPEHVDLSSLGSAIISATAPLSRRLPRSA